MGQIRQVRNFPDRSQGPRPPRSLIGFDKYRVLADERKQIAKLIKEQEPKVSNRQIAKLVGTSHQSVGRDVGPSGPLRGDNPNQIKGANVVSGPSGPLGAPADISGGRAARLVMQRETGAANRIAKLVGWRARP